MKKIILKLKELKNCILNTRVCRFYFVPTCLFEDVDLNKISRSSFSLEHHLTKLF